MYKSTYIYLIKDKNIFFDKISNKNITNNFNKLLHNDLSKFLNKQLQIFMYKFNWHNQQSSYVNIHVKISTNLCMDNSLTKHTFDCRKKFFNLTHLQTIV